MKSLLPLFLLLAAAVSSSGSEVLPISRYGFRDYPPSEKLDSTPVEPNGYSGQLGFPWKNRLLEIDLGKKQQVDRIELNLLKMQRKRPETTANVENLVIYQSTDNRVFRKVKPSQISHELYQEKGNSYDRVAIHGNFSGRYLKIYVPWQHPYYVLGTNHLNQAIRVFGQVPVALKMSAIPLAAARNFPVAIQADFQPSSTGELLLTITPGPAKPLWQSPLKSLSPGVRQTVELDLVQLPPGIKTLTLSYRQDGQTVVQATRQFRWSPNGLLVVPKNTNGWQSQEVQVDGKPLAAWKSARPQAILTYAIPQSGQFAVYAALVGTSSQCQLITAFKTWPVQLDTWHPADTSAPLAGETMVGVMDFKAGETVRIKALQAGVFFLALRLQPVTPEQAAIWKRQTELTPAMIVHSDGYSPFYFKRYTTPDAFRKVIETSARNAAYAFDWCVGTTAVNYPSQVASLFGGQNRFWRQGDRQAAEQIHEWIASGNDPVKLVVETCRANRLRSSLTLRANACYSSTMPSMNSIFYDQNPRLRQQDTVGRPKILLSYAYPETRQYFLSMIGEMAAYRPDAIVIEFLRHPPFFGYDPPLIQEYRRRYGQCVPENFMNLQWQQIQLEIMTGFIKQVRQTIDAVDPRIHLEVSFDQGLYRQQGLDIPAWLTNGWIDLISPGYYHIGQQKLFSLAPFVEMVKKSPRPCRIFPRVEATITGSDPTPAEEQGLIKVERRNVSPNMFRYLFLRFQAEGAAGLRPFNTGGPDLARQLANQPELERFREFTMPLLNIRSQVLFPQKEN